MNWTFNSTNYASVQILRVSRETMVRKMLTSCTAEHDFPVGQLAWMGEKWIECECIAIWSIETTRPKPAHTGADVRAEESPSVFTHNEILRSISLYYLTDTFMPSVYTYAQEPQFPYQEGIYRRARTDAPMLVSYFKYPIKFWPEDVLRTYGSRLRPKLMNIPVPPRSLADGPDRLQVRRLLCWFGEPVGSGGRSERDPRSLDRPEIDEKRHWFSS